MSIGHSGTVATVYNVGKIKEGVSPPAKIIAVVGSKALGKTPSAYSISQNTKNVNKNNDNSAKFSVSAKESGKTYLDGLKRGDTETTRRTVDEAAKATSPIADVAPTGSKEARQLEKVKSLFEEAYRSGGKVTTKTEHSISNNIVDQNGKEYERVVKLEYDVFKKVSRNGKAYVDYIRNNLIKEKITVFDSNGNEEIVEFAGEKKEYKKRVQKTAISL